MYFDCIQPFMPPPNCFQILPSPLYFSCFNLVAICWSQAINKLTLFAEPGLANIGNVSENKEKINKFVSHINI